MKQFFLISVLLLCSSFSILAQANLSDYSFVVVPENFEFTSEKDQFQLNSMTKYYLEKNGFNAYFQTELPRVNNCDGLYADVVSKGSFITTTTQIFLRDCEGTLVYSSEEGRSKKKDYRQAHQESLRDAFKSFNKLNVKQTAIIVDTSKSNVDIAAEKRQIEIERARLKSIKNENNTSNNTTEAKFIQGPLNKFTYYKNLKSSYLLRKSDAGYFFYLENQESAMGLELLGELTLLPNKAAYSIKGVYNGVAQFLENGDLSVQNKGKTSIFKFQN